MNAREAAVAALETRLGHDFGDKDLLERALTHSSVGDGARKVGDNERLEFLGDRVLGLLAAEYLLREHPEAAEGDLSPRLHVLVDRQACARVGRRLGLGPALRLAAGETRRGARDHDTILADACEAVIAAVFLDAGLDQARAVWRTLWSEELAAPADPRSHNPKSALQEWALGAGKPLPVYSVSSREGPDHAPLFTVEVRVEGLAAATGTGSSRQAAEKAAAQALLEQEQRT